MRLVTLNIRQGGGRRTSKLVEYLISQDADLLVLSEYRPNEYGRVVRKELFDAGFGFFACAGTLENINSVAIASRMPFILRDFPALLECDHHRVIGVRLSEIDILGVYFAHGPKKASLYDFFLENGQEFEAETIIIGHFNTGLHFQDETRSTFKLADRFATLPSKGFFDAWRSRNAHGREFSWYSHVGNGFRIDHVFCTRSVDDRILGVHYDHSPRTSRITDHSALIVDLADL